MKLKEFITESLTEIMEGVREAQLRFKNPSDGQINPAPLNQPTSSGASQVSKDCLLSAERRLIQSVKFDVAVTAEDGTGTRAGVGVILAAFNLGAQGESKNAHASVNRIQFEVPISLPH